MRVLADKLNSGQQVILGVVGTSIGQGFYCDNFAAIVRDANFQITWESSYDATVRGWLVQSREYLKTLNANSDIYNVSIGGGTLQDHITLGNIALLASQTPKPDAIIVGCQINDSISPTKWVTIPQYVLNLHNVVSQVRSHGITPIILLESDIDSSRYADNRTDGKTFPDVVGAARDYAIRNSIPTWKLYEAWKPLIAGGAMASGLHYDTVHPNQAGHNLIATKFPEFLQTLAYYAPMSRSKWGSL